MPSSREPRAASRDLALELNVSRNTVVGAYDQLVSEGYLDSRPRSCLFVNELISPGRLPSVTPSSKPLPKLMSALHLSPYGTACGREP